ncbi:MAG: FtsQ-type POTRA domain-containing protein [Hyphomicrobiaceae bacterium]|nr:FtsQ-type POTRA domain-containing protein [Hyphomicrobiaceae bacterium]
MRTRVPRTRESAGNAALMAHRARDAARRSSTRAARTRPALIARLFPLLGALAGAFGFLLLTDGGRRTQPVEPLLAQADRIAARIGLGFVQASVSGHRMTPDGDILDALHMGKSKSLLTFDKLAARRRIEALPWVSEARLTTVWPHLVKVRVRERTPFAVWRKADHDVLVDRDGRQLAKVRRGAVGGLVVLAGSGAPEAAPAFLKKLAVHAELARSVVALERVGERRWTVHLAGGRSVYLPEKDVAGALALLTSGAAGTRLIDAAFERIDLRDPLSVRVRSSGPSAVGRRAG